MYKYSCPRDNSVLGATSGTGAKGYECPACGGLWLPTESLRARLGVSCSERLAALPVLKHVLARCPDDGRPLEEVRLDGVMVDRCPSCAGLWLDPGELERIVAAHLAKFGEGKGEGKWPGGPFSVLELVFEVLVNALILWP